MRILIALPGLHRVDRGAEVAFLSIARALAAGGDDVTVIGSGPERPGTPYGFLHAGCVPRESFEALPSFPGLRDDCAYEELTFLPGLLRRYRPGDYDVTLTCGYPYTNWALRRPSLRGRRPPHVFVTQNGDWPAQARNSEFRFFGCDGLICTNPDFFQRNKDRWRCALIPNGVDTERFRPGPAERTAFALPLDRPVILMASALIASKRVDLGIRSASLVPDAHLVVAGEGPLRRAIDDLAARLLPGRFTRLTVTPDRMPALYRSADAFLHLSKDEAFGNVLLEAMASGLPVVAWESPRSRWILGDGELLTGSDEPGDVARLIGLACERSCERSRAAPSGRVSAFAWPAVAAMYREFLSETAGMPISARGQRGRIR